MHVRLAHTIASYDKYNDRARRETNRVMIPSNGYLASLWADFRLHNRGFYRARAKHALFGHDLGQNVRVKAIVRQFR